VKTLSAASDISLCDRMLSPNIIGVFCNLHLSTLYCSTVRELSLPLDEYVWSSANGRGRNYSSKRLINGEKTLSSRVDIVCRCSSRSILASLNSRESLTEIEDMIEMDSANLCP
jgi:hypothetical protein